MKEAKCPDCGEWSDVRWMAELPPGGFWWAGDEGGGGCPKCGALICVESECDFREKATAIVIADPIDTSKIRAGFLGIDPGDPSGAALVTAADNVPSLLWSGQGPSEGSAMASVLKKARDAAFGAGLAIPPIVAIEGQFLPALAGRGDAKRAVAVDVIALSKSAGGWRAMAQAAGFPLLDADGLGFQPSAWRDILGGPGPGGLTSHLWKRWAVVMVESVFGGAMLPMGRAHEAEAILIGLAALIARSDQRELARWVGHAGRQAALTVDPRPMGSR